MNAVDICLAFLLVSGAFALICLGLLFLKASHTLRDVSSLSSDLEDTVKKLNVTIDDVNYKMDRLNAPINFLSELTERKRENPGVLGFLMGLRSTFKRNK